MLVKCNVENSTLGQLYCSNQTKLHFRPKTNATTTNYHEIALCEPLQWSTKTDKLSKANRFNVNTPGNWNSGKDVRSPPPYKRCSLAISSARAL